MNSTQARTNFFDLINEAFYSKKETIITKNGQVMARIVPPAEEEFDWDEYLIWLKNFEPFLTDEDVAEYKKIRAEKSRFPDW